MLFEMFSTPLLDRSSPPGLVIYIITQQLLFSWLSEDTLCDWVWQNIMMCTMKAYCYERKYEGTGFYLILSILHFISLYILSMYQCSLHAAFLLHEYCITKRKPHTCTHSFNVRWQFSLSAKDRATVLFCIKIDKSIQNGLLLYL